MPRLSEPCQRAGVGQQLSGETVWERRWVGGVSLGCHVVEGIWDSSGQWDRDRAALRKAFPVLSPARLRSSTSGHSSTFASGSASRQVASVGLTLSQ